MSELCESFCPNYQACLARWDVTAAEKGSLMDSQDALQAGMANHDQGTLDGAFAILSGELTAEQHDELQARLDADPAIITPNYGEDLSIIDRALAGNAAEADQVAETHHALAKEMEICDGPTLGVVRSLMFNIKHRTPGYLKRFATKADMESHEASKQLAYQYELMRHAKCGNPQATHIAKRLLSRLAA